MKNIILKLVTKFDRLIGDNWRLSVSAARKRMNHTTTMCYLEVRE